MKFRRWLALSMPVPEVERLFDQLLAEDPDELYRNVPKLDEVHWPLLVAALASCTDFEARLLLLTDVKSRPEISQFVALIQQRSADPKAVLKTLKSPLAGERQVLALCLSQLLRGFDLHRITAAHGYAALVVNGEAKQRKALLGVQIPAHFVDWMRAVCKCLPKDRAAPFTEFLKTQAEGPRPVRPERYVRRTPAPPVAAPARPNRYVAPAEAFAAVYTAPHLDGPRAVLADLLLEQHEPLGELIQLQLHRLAGKRGTLGRERELFETHKSELWPDHPVGIGQLFSNFEDLDRGFPSCFNGVPNRETAARLPQHPGWSTIRIFRSWADQPLSALFPPEMPMLKRLLDLTPALLNDVRARAWPVEEVTLHRDDGAIEAVTGLPRLRLLSVNSKYDLATAIARLEPSGLLERLTELEVLTYGPSLAAMLEIFPKLPPQLTTLRNWFTLTREPHGLEAAVECREDELDEVLGQLQAVPSERLASVHLVMNKTGGWTKKTKPDAEAAARKVLARFKKSTLS